MGAIDTQDRKHGSLSTPFISAQRVTQIGINAGFPDKVKTLRPNLNVLARYPCELFAIVFFFTEPATASLATIKN